MKPLIRLMATFGDENAEQIRLRCDLDTGALFAVLPESGAGRAMIVLGEANDVAALPTTLLRQFGLMPRLFSRTLVRIAAA